MDSAFLDHPQALAVLFHPRSAKPGRSRLPNVDDGSIALSDGTSLGYRLYKHEPSAPVIIYFHGNGEIAPDYDYSAGEYRRAGASLLVIDYRGYGWSTGRPLASTLLSDAEQAADVLPDILGAVGYGTAPLFLMGRSLGSAPAIHLAHQDEERYRGLIIESGFSAMIPLLARLGLVVPQLSGTTDPLGNLDKMREIGLPLLVIHSENDQLIPVSNGQALYDASPSDLKRIKRIPYAGHNDLQMVAVDEYFAAIGDFLRDALESEHGK